MTPTRAAPTAAPGAIGAQAGAIRGALSEVDLLRAAAARAIRPIRGSGEISGFVMEGIALAGLAMMRLWLAPVDGSGRAPSVAETAIGAATLIENLLAGSDGQDDPAVGSVAGDFGRAALAAGETPLDVAMLGPLDEDGSAELKGFASFRSFIESLPGDDEDSMRVRHAGRVAISVYTTAARMTDCDTFTALAWDAASALRAMGLEARGWDMREWE